MTTRADANNFFSQQAILKGGVMAPADVAAWIETETNKIVSAIPEDVRAEYSEDPVIAAYDYYAQYEKLNDKLNGGEGAQAPGAATGLATTEKAKAGKVQSFIRPTLSTAMDNAISELLESSQDERIKRGETAKIEKITLPRPSYGGLLKELNVTTVQPDVSDDKMKEWEDALFDNSATASEDGFDSKSNFEKLKAANHKQKLPIYTTKSRTIVGALVSWEEPNTKDHRERKQVDMNGLKGMLNTLFFTKIGTNAENGLGVEVSGIVSKDTSNSGTLGAGKSHTHIIRLRWDTGKKAVLDNAENSPFVNYRDTEVREGNKIQVSKEPRTVRIDLPFKITKSAPVDGVTKKKVVTVRPTGKINLPLFKRASNEMIDVFGPDAKAPISSRFGEKEKREAATLQAEFMAGVMAGEVGDISSYGQSLASIVRELRKADSKAAPDASAFVG